MMLVGAFVILALLGASIVSVTGHRLDGRIGDRDARYDRIRQRFHDRRQRKITVCSSPQKLQDLAGLLEDTGYAHLFPRFTMRLRIDISACENNDLNEETTTVASDELGRRGGRHMRRCRFHRRRRCRRPSRHRRLYRLCKPCSKFRYSKGNLLRTIVRGAGRENEFPEVFDSIDIPQNETITLH